MEAVKRTYQKHKTEYKITVKHYLNKTTKEFSSSLKQVYQIYIQVTYKSKSTKFRSRLNPISCSKVDKGELGLDNLKECISRDTALIESIINEYDNYNIALSKDERFDINDLVSLYRNDNFNLIYFIDFCLRLEIQELIESNTGEKFSFIYPVKPLTLLEFYLPEYPFLKSIRENFNSDIWFFDIYLEQIEYGENYELRQRLKGSEIVKKFKITNFHRNGWTLTLQDFKDNYAQKSLLDYFDDSLKVKEIFLDIEKLIVKYGKDYFIKTF
jgi:hypothetical protein